MKIKLLRPTPKKVEVKNPVNPILQKKQVKLVAIMRVIKKIPNLIIGVCIFNPHFKVKYTVLKHSIMLSI